MRNHSAPRGRKDSSMKVLRVAAGLAAAILVTSSAPSLAASNPARKPLGQMKCADFLGYEDAAKPEIVYWAAIHDRGGRKIADVVDVDDTDRIVPRVVEKCRMTPEESLWHQVKAETSRFGKQALEQKEGRPRPD